MEIVVDSSILISSLIKSVRIRELICSQKLILHAPEHLIVECLRHKADIIKMAGIEAYEFDRLIAVLLGRINIVPEEEFKQLIKEALKLVTHPEDAPFIAVSLDRNIPLWSDDKALKQQSVVKVFSTEELLNLLDS